MIIRISITMHPQRAKSAGQTVFVVSEGNDIITAGWTSTDIDTLARRIRDNLPEFMDAVTNGREITIDPD